MMTLGGTEVRMKLKLKIPNIKEVLKTRKVSLIPERNCSLGLIKKVLRLLPSNQISLSCLNTIHMMAAAPTQIKMSATLNTKLIFPNEKGMKSMV